MQSVDTNPQTQHGKPPVKRGKKKKKKTLPTANTSDCISSKEIINQGVSYSTILPSMGGGGGGSGDTRTTPTPQPPCMPAYQPKPSLADLEQIMQTPLQPKEWIPSHTGSRGKDCVSPSSSHNPLT